MPLTQLRALPATDVLGLSFAVFRSHRRYVDVTRPVAQFLAQCAELGLMPVLETREEALVSPLLAQEVQPLLGRWVVRVGEGLIDVRTSQPVDPVTYEPVGQASQHAWRSLAAPQTCVAIDLSVFHRATVTLVVGRVLAELARLLGAPEPHYWGQSYPLLRPWDEQEFTRECRSRMPVTPLYRIGAERSLAVEASYRRSSDGVVERLQGVLHLGGDAVRATAAARAVEAMQALASRYRLLAGVALVTQTDTGVYSGTASRRPPAPCVFAAGPVALREAGVDRTAMVRDYGAIAVGRSKTSTLLFPAGPDGGWGRWGRVLDSIGFDAAWGAAGGRR